MISQLALQRMAISGFLCTYVPCENACSRCNRWSVFCTLHHGMYGNSAHLWWKIVMQPVRLKPVRCHKMTHLTSQEQSVGLYMRL